MNFDVPSRRSRKPKVDVDAFFKNKFDYKIIYKIGEALKDVKYAEEPENKGFQMSSDLIIDANKNEARLVIAIEYGEEFDVTSYSPDFESRICNFGKEGVYCFYLKNEKLCGLNAYIPNKLGSLESLYLQTKKIKTSLFSITIYKTIEKIKRLLKSYRPVELYSTGQTGFHEHVSYDKQDEREDFGACFLCYLPRLDGEEISILPCQHRFHHHCTMGWLEKNKNCPLCNDPARKEAWYATKNDLFLVEE